MAYTSEKKEFNENSLFEDGLYKATIEKVEEKDNFDKTSKQLNIWWRLENNQIYFDKVNKDKNNPQDYNHTKIGNILYGCSLGDVENTEQLIKKLVGASCTLKISKKYSDKYQKEYNQVDEYIKSASLVTDDDLPF